MGRHGLAVLATSRFFATPAFPPGSGPDFVNAAATISTQLSPLSLLKQLHQIEAIFGRTRTNRWESRTLDLDLLAMGEDVLPNATTAAGWIGLPLAEQVRNAPDELILPHPRLQDRAFVLIPLADIAPAWRHPLSGLTVADMLNALPEAEKAQVRPFVG